MEGGGGGGWGEVEWWEAVGCGGEGWGGGRKDRGGWGVRGGGEE